MNLGFLLDFNTYLQSGLPNNLVKKFFFQLTKNSIQKIFCFEYKRGAIFLNQGSLEIKGSVSSKTQLSFFI